MTGSDARTEPRRIAVLALPPVIGYDLVIPPQVFGQANVVLGRPAYDLRVTSLDGGPVPTLQGYSIAPQEGVDFLAEADVVIVPGTAMREVRRDGVLPEALRAALATVRPGTTMVSICTGAFALAAAGVLDDRRATTHWDKAADLRRLYPAVLLDEDVLFIDDGDVLTSAGLSAGVDLCLHMLRADHGPAVANAVARYLVVQPFREGGQAQFIDRPLPEVGEQSTAGVRSWLLDHLDQRHTVAELAARAHMSPRTFARRFREETGHAPANWITEQRLHHAERLLEGTDLPIDQVAARSGLGTGASLRQHLRRRAGVDPSTYRRTFRGPVLAEPGTPA